MLKASDSENVDFSFFFGGLLCKCFFWQLFCQLYICIPYIRKCIILYMCILQMYIVTKLEYQGTT